MPGEHRARGTRAPAAFGEDARSYNIVEQLRGVQPDGATGARMVTTMANELAKSGKETALLGICAAGGLGAGAVIERV